MNFREIRREFDRIQRSIDDDTFAEYRDDYINHAFVKISELFRIPSLKRNVLFDATEDEDTYLLPYDFGGTEVNLYYSAGGTGSKKRLDPVPEEVLALQYERRTGNMGQVDYYDWASCAGSDLAVRTDCVIVNNSATVNCASAAAADVDNWVRFDPFVDANNVTQDPGDYGYLITAVTAGVSWTLDRAYRGPTSTVANAATGRVQPAEQQQFKTYGNPAQDGTDAFDLTYYALPRRLYNDADVPEWPAIGLAIAYMAIALGYDFIQHFDASKVWFGRAMSKVEGLRRRRHTNQALVTDLSIGSVVGRRTGPRGVTTRRGYTRRY